MRRQQELERCGWQFFRVMGSSFYRDQASALALLWKVLEHEDFSGSSKDLSGKNEIVASEEDNGKMASDNTSSQSNDRPDHDEIDLPVVDVNEDTNEESQNDADSETQSDKTQNSNVQDLLAMSNYEMGRTICTILENRPNNSCKRDDLVTFVCQYYQIRTRGNPKKQLARKLSSVVNNLKKRNKVQEYKAKNQRIRLVKRDGGDPTLWD